MMPEISKPTRRRYWIARSADGSVLHVGKTEPWQVTTTGQPLLESTENIEDHLDALAPFADRFPELPEPGETVLERSYYRSRAGVILCREEHVRDASEPRDDSRFEVSTAERQRTRP